MKEFSRKVQAFEDVGEKAKNESEPEFHKILIEWAKKQPQSPFGYIDIASGLGIEASLLTACGFTCIAQDPSVEMVRQNKNSDARIGTAEKLDYPDNSFSGIILKDSWLFLSPEQRIACLSEAQRTMVSSGSMIIKSESAEISRARYLPHSSKLAQSLPSSDYDSYDEWVQAVVKLSEDNEIFSIEYRSMFQDVIGLSNNADLTVTSYLEYDSKDPLATDNRWVKKSGFLVVLRNDQDLF